MKRKKIILDNIIFVLAPIVFIIIWQFACNYQWVNTRILPSPKEVFDALRDLLATNKFQQHLIASVRRVALGFAFGATAGVLMGFLTGISRTIDDFVGAAFSVLRSIPTIGLMPLLILFYGIGEESKLVVIGLGTFWSVLLNTQQGISSTDIKLLEVGKMLEKSKLTVILKIVLPAALPSMFTGMRLGLSNAWKSVVAAEMIASVRGIGYMISYAREMFQTDVMFVGLFTLGIIGLALDILLLQLQKKLVFWG